MSSKGFISRLGLLRPALTLALVIAGLLALAPGLAQAAAPARWVLESKAAPTNLPVAHEGKAGVGYLTVNVANVGGSAVDGEGEQVKVVERLPAGVEATNVRAASRGTPGSINNEQGTGAWTCAPDPHVINCTFGKELTSYEQLEILVNLKVTTETPSEPLNEVEVEGGKTAPASLKRPVPINSLPTNFGVEQFEIATENENGSQNLEAGSHPYQMTTTFGLNETITEDNFLGTHDKVPGAPALQRNLGFKLPPGLIGDPNVGGRCRSVDFLEPPETKREHVPERQRRRRRDRDRQRPDSRREHHGGRTRLQPRPQPQPAGATRLQRRGGPRRAEHVRALRRRLRRHG